MAISDLWPLAIEAWEALGAGYGPVMARTAAKEAGFPEGAYFGWILPALGLDPDPISAWQLAAWSPYTALALDESRLAASAQLGFLRDAGGGNYYLTDAGQTAAKRITSAAYAYMASLQPLPAADLGRLSDLLRRLVDACLAAPEPPDKWHLQLSRRTDPGEAAPIVARIDQYLTDLNAYRNDASLSVWQPLGVSGAAWEAFTCIWRGEAQTLDELCSRLAMRRHACSDYADALADLVAQGWAVTTDGRYRLNDVGRTVREDAERGIDQCFFAPWACLEAREAVELAALLGGLRDGLSGKPAEQTKM
jgi:hypothetical protein